MAPLPEMSATVKVSPALMRTEGETFQPCPSPRAHCSPVPVVAMPPAPFAPLKFSGLIERVCAAESLLRLPRLRPSPLKAFMGYGYDA
jgi:hypothetical protein